MRGRRAAATAFVVVLLAGRASAHSAAAGLGTSAESLAVPPWLYVLTGGVAIGASALLAALVTDRDLVAASHEWRRALPGADAAALLGPALRVASVAALALVVYRGFTGPATPVANLASLAVFAGARAGLTAVAYLLGNPWPALNPWRTLARWLPHGRLDYPERLGRWPALAGLLALVWVETTTPVASDPAALAWALCGYTAATVAGGVLFGPGVWFERADPVSAAFDLYGRVAPVSWADGRPTLRPPGAGLVGGLADRAEVALAVALVWELTFTGFVPTAPGTATLAAVPLPRTVVLAGLFLGGYAAFLGAFRGAARLAADRLRTFETGDSLALTFGGSLLAVAAGYHLAHYGTFFVSLVPALAAAAATPLSAPANPVLLVLPGWAGMLDVAFVLLGHLLAVWVAHAAAYRTFPDRLQAVRSQFPAVAVMVCYTAVSLWVVALPTAS